MESVPRCGADGVHRYHEGMDLRAPALARRGRGLSLSIHLGRGAAVAVAFLVLGVLATVAVAWACVRWSPTPGVGGESAPAGKPWPIQPPTGWPATWRSRAVVSGPGVRVDLYYPLS